MPSYPMIHMIFSWDSFKNRKIDIYCNDGECDYDRTSRMMSDVLEYKNDVWNKLGQLVGPKHVSFASGLSMQNELMIVGGSRGYLDLSDIKPSYMFDEDTGDSKIIPDMGFIDYLRPLMILVDHDFCQGK